MNTITFTHNGTNYTADYEVVSDTLIVTLPDGKTREIVLRGLKPEITTLTHLKSYVLSLDRKSKKEHS